MVCEQARPISQSINQSRELNRYQSADQIDSLMVFETRPQYASVGASPMRAREPPSHEANDALVEVELELDVIRSLPCCPTHHRHPRPVVIFDESESVREDECR